MSSTNRFFRDRSLEFPQFVKFIFLLIAWVSVFVMGYVLNSGEYAKVFVQPDAVGISYAQIDHQDISPQNIAKPTIHSTRELSTVGFTDSTPDYLYNFMMIMFTWTWSNVLILCCLASLLGEFGRIAMSKENTPNIMAALVRGFFIFLFLTAGQLIFNGSISVPDTGGLASTVRPTTAADYTRLSGMCSLFAFAVGYRPKLFHDFLIRIGGDNGDSASDC